MIVPSVWSRPRHEHADGAGRWPGTMGPISVSDLLERGPAEQEPLLPDARGSARSASALSPSPSMSMITPRPTWRGATSSPTRRPSASAPLGVGPACGSQRPLDDLVAIAAAPATSNRREPNDVARPERGRRLARTPRRARRGASGSRRGSGSAGCTASRRSSMRLHAWVRYSRSRARVMPTYASRRSSSSSSGSPSARRWGNTPSSMPDEEHRRELEALGRVQRHQHDRRVVVARARRCRRPATPARGTR